MKTDPKNQKRVQGSRLHPELAFPNNNPRKLYDVEVHRTDYCYMIVRVKAKTGDEAEDKAEKIAGLKPDALWQVADRKLYASHSELVEEGGRHE